MTEHSLFSVLLICIAFVGIHSSMASTQGKAVLLKIFGARFMKCYYRLLFVMVSAATMIAAFMMLVNLPDIYLYRSPMWLKWMMHFLQISGMVFGMMSLKVLDASEFFGIRQMLRCRKRGQKNLTASTVDGLSLCNITKCGVYSIVRHPIYLAGILMISLQPDITCNRLLVTILADSYFIFAAFKEERLLLQNPDLEYAAYCAQIPMFNIVKGLYAGIGRNSV